MHQVGKKKTNEGDSIDSQRRCHNGPRDTARHGLFWTVVDEAIPIHTVHVHMIYKYNIKNMQPARERTQAHPNPTRRGQLHTDLVLDLLQTWAARSARS